MLDLSPPLREFKRARSIYQNSERQKVQRILGGIVDPSLDDLCLLPLEAYPAKQSYDATRDFPYFAECLQDLQTYILCQNPNRAKLLWKDRLDALRWYTFWTVIIIGGISIFLAVAQTVLSALQVTVAFKVH